MRDSSLVEAHVRAILISKKVTQEGEVMPYAQTELSVSVEGSAMLICLKLKCHLFRSGLTVRERRMNCSSSGQPPSYTRSTQTAHSMK